MRAIPAPPAKFVERVGGALGTGQAHVDDLVRYAHFGNAGTEAALDLGCGVGRTAAVLAERFPRTHYEGLDVEREPIEWCEREIAARYPRFHFTHVDLRNAAYNPNGVIAPE